MLINSFICFSIVISCYVKQYSFDGYLYQVFHGQIFTFADKEGESISGNSILRDFYGIVEVNPWGLLAIVFSFVILFRVFHFMLFSHSVSPKIYIRRIILNCIRGCNKYARVASN